MADAVANAVFVHFCSVTAPVASVYGTMIGGEIVMSSVVPVTVTSLTTVNCCRCVSTRMFVPSLDVWRGLTA